MKPGPRVRVECNSRFENHGDHAVTLPIGTPGLTKITITPTRGPILKGTPFQSAGTVSSRSVLSSPHQSALANCVSCQIWPSPPFPHLPSDRAHACTTSVTKDSPWPWRVSAQEEAFDLNVRQLLLEGWNLQTSALEPSSTDSNHGGIDTFDARLPDELHRVLPAIPSTAVCSRLSHFDEPDDTNARRKAKDPQAVVTAHAPAHPGASVHPSRMEEDDRRSQEEVLQQAISGVFGEMC